MQLQDSALQMQAHKARVILSKSGELLDYAQYRRLMAEEEGL